MKIFHDVDVNKHIPIVSMIQDNINRIFNWAFLNNLPLNVSKCCYMIINTSSCRNMKQANVTYSCNNVDLVKTENHMDLGVTFNENWNFDKHISTCISKANHACAIVHWCFSFANPKVNILLFNMYIHPLVEYGSIVWSPYLKN